MNDKDRGINLSASLQENSSNGYKLFIQISREDKKCINVLRKIPKHTGEELDKVPHGAPVISG